MTLQYGQSCFHRHSHFHTSAFPCIPFLCITFGHKLLAGGGVMGTCAPVQSWCHGQRGGQQGGSKWASVTEVCADLRLVHLRTQIHRIFGSVDWQQILGRRKSADVNWCGCCSLMSVIFW